MICCETCPRVFHLKCIQLENSPTEDWVCPECVLIMTAENMDTRCVKVFILSEPAALSLTYPSCYTCMYYVVNAHT